MMSIKSVYSILAILAFGLATLPNVARAQTRAFSDRTSQPIQSVQSGNNEPIAKLNYTAPVTGIVSAGSTFVDTGRDQIETPTVGSASLLLVKANGRLLVMTAAHVIAGKDPWVEVQGVRLPVKAALLDNDRDIAIIEVDKVKSAPAFIYDGMMIKANPTLIKKIDHGRAPVVILAYYFPNHALGFALRPWVDPGVETARARGIVHAPHVSMNHNREQVRIYTKVTSGASGSAVFDLREETLTGLIVQSHYYLSETYLAAAPMVVKHLELFLEGKRGSLTPTEWRMHNGLTYRNFGDGIEEANFINRPASGVIGASGKGTIGQPGKGTIGQPGKGTIGQPGKGTIGQPGKGTIGQPGKGTIGQPGKGTIGQPGGELDAAQSWSMSPREVFANFNMQPGMVWKGRPLVGFKIEMQRTSPSTAATQEAWPESFNLFAEAEALRFVRENRLSLSIEPIGFQINFVELLRARLKRNHANAVFGPSAVVNDLEIPSEPKESEITIGEDHIRVKVKTYARIDRSSWKLVPDEIEFKLGKNGALMGEPMFMPVIETKGLKTGETYYVDLRQFFFADLSQIIRPMDDWSKENAPADPLRFDQKRQLETIGLSVRNAESGAEFTFGF